MLRPGDDRRKQRAETGVLLNARQGAPANRARVWTSVLGLSLDQLIAWGVLYYSYAVISAPMARDLSLSPRFVAVAFSLTLLISGLLARPVGRVMDWEGARGVLRIGAVLGPLAFASLALARGEVSLLLAFAALGLAHAASLYEPAICAIVGWFPLGRGRTPALTLLTSCGALASTAFLPLTALLVAQVGWRMAVLVLAALLALVSVPVRWAIPSTCAASERREGTPLRALQVGRATQHGAATRWLGAGFALQAFASTGTSVYLVWHLLEQGAPMQEAAVTAGLAGAAQIPGRLSLLPLSRVLRTGVRLPLLFLVQAGALAAIAVGPGALLPVAIVLFGAAAGTMTLERAAVTLEHFGRDAFGAQSGRITSISFVARAASPFAVEVLRGHIGYAGAFAVLSLGLAAGAVAVSVAGATVSSAASA